MSTDFKQLCVAAWRGYSLALHASLHGKASAANLQLTEAEYDGASPHTRRAVEGACRAVLAEMTEGNTTAADVLAADPAPAPQPAAQAQDGLDPDVVAKQPLKAAPEPGWPGAAGFKS